MKGLTDKQRGILDFIEEFMEINSMSPSVYEIAERFSIKTSTAFAHIRALQRKGFLERSKKARSISLPKSKNRPLHMSFALPIPLLGRINAGVPAESLEFKEGDIACDRTIIGDADINSIFALKVHGESMRDIGMYEDDIIIIKQVSSPRTGDIVVALVEDSTTVKSYYPIANNKVELRPANPEFQTQTYNAEDVHIQGIVIGLQRKY